MRDTELYRHLLGLGAPWEVGRVELSVADGRVDVWVEHPGPDPVRLPGLRCVAVGL